eukprot:CAMPEP_0204610188 /NCGR_PEP_ID=MMETSP0661-20131031/61375_1 /ASSEMBLY_ACC=CAM_ASM_000606 /TAXON_ID=109239 /ORGANISM="Alexandrium margalefi, Strain AMGDE01CS-322" /LENGTH=134 /DNA_ID=CAMNT_0051621989 /DNA_START=362 /DNA_END=767 /DNA_ORIENTATION=+
MTPCRRTRSGPDRHSHSASQERAALKAADSLYEMTTSPQRLAHPPATSQALVCAPPRPTEAPMPVPQKRTKCQTALAGIAGEGVEDVLYAHVAEPQKKPGFRTESTSMQSPAYARSHPSQRAVMMAVSGLAKVG